MVSYTPEYSFPYAADSDYQRNFPTTVSQPLAERVEARVKELSDRNTALEAQNTALEGQVEELETFKTAMIQTVAALNGLFLELSQKKTQTIVSDYTSDTSEKFVITRIGSLVTIAGSIKSTADADDTNAYVSAIRLPGWAHPGSNGNNVVFETQVNSPIDNVYTTSYGIITGFNVRLVGPFSTGDTVRGYATYITDRDFS